MPACPPAAHHVCARALSSPGRQVNKHIKKGKYDEDPLSSGGIAGLDTLCKGLMTIDRERRLGCDEGGFAKLKAHPFFASIDWARLASGELEAPIRPRADQMNSPPLAVLVCVPAGVIIDW